MQKDSIEDFIFLFAKKMEIINFLDSVKQQHPKIFDKKLSYKMLPKESQKIYFKVVNAITELESLKMKHPNIFNKLYLYQKLQELLNRDGTALPESLDKTLREAA